VLQAKVELRSLHGRRVAPLAEFITGPRRNNLRPGEILWSVRIPRAASGARAVYFKVGRRKALAIAVASLAAAWTLEPDGSIQRIRLAWGSVGPRVMAFPEIEDALRGQRLSVVARMVDALKLTTECDGRRFRRVLPSRARSFPAAGI
jgi:CO/xanthine dehydrogenase FAD-binding subunit